MATKCARFCHLILRTCTNRRYVSWISAVVWGVCPAHAPYDGGQPRAIARRRTVPILRGFFVVSAPSLQQTSYFVRRRGIHNPASPCIYPVQREIITGRIVDPLVLLHKKVILVASFCPEFPLIPKDKVSASLTGAATMVGPSDPYQPALPRQQAQKKRRTV